MDSDCPDLRHNFKNIEPQSLIGHAKRRIIDRLLLVLAVSTITFSPVLFLLGGRLSFLLCSISAVVFSIMYILAQKGFYSFISYGLSFFLLLIAAGALYFGGGIHDVTIVMFPGILLISSLLLPLKTYWIFAITAIFCIVSVGLAELLGYKVVSMEDISGDRDIPILVFLIGLSAFFYRQFTQRIVSSNRDSLSHAKNYYEIFNTVNDGIIILDATSFEIVDVNQAYAELAMSTPEELKGQNGVKRLLSNGDFGPEEAEQIILRTINDGPQVVRWHARLQSGETKWLSVSIKVAEVFERDCIIAILQDIDDQVRVSRSLEQNDKLKALGQLAGGIAHDFNNQLMGIKGYTELLQNQLQDKTHILYLDMVDKAVTRATDLTNKLLSFARKGISLKEKVSLNSIIEETYHLLSRSIDQKIKIELILPEFTAYVRGDSTQLQNVLLNLAINSRDAISDRGRITISLQECSRETELPEQLKENEAEDYYLVSVIDTGTGINEENLPRIFDPFFTTKEQGKGTGLGLSAVMGTMEMHEGFVSCDSEPGKGTIFTLYLPRFRDITPLDADPSQKPD